MMKLLLTDSGIRNATIRDALVNLLDKPIAESSALCIPTAGYGGPGGGPGGPWRFISGRSPSPMTALGWKSVGVLELTALPSIEEALWVSWVREADVLLVNGGDALYLCHWMRESGLAGLLPSLPETVYVGLSAGSMAMTPRVGAEFMGWKPPAGGDSALGVVDFSIFPHLDHPACPENTMAAAERWAAGIAGPAYAIDEQTAIMVADGAVEVSPRAIGGCSSTCGYTRITAEPGIPLCLAGLPPRLRRPRGGVRRPVGCRRRRRGGRIRMGPNRT